MIPLLLVLLFYSGLWTVSVYLTKSLFHPLAVHALIWGMQIMGLILFSNMFIEPNVKALSVVVCGSIFFAVGSFMSLGANFSVLGRQKLRTINEHSVLMRMLLLIVLLATFLKYRTFSEVTSGKSFAVSLVYIRVLMTHDMVEVYSGLAKYGSSLAFVLVLVFQISIHRYGANRTKLFLYLVALSCYLIMALLSSGRGPVLHIFMVSFVAYALVSRPNIVKLSRASAGLVVVAFLIFWIIGAAMGKASTHAYGAVFDIVSYMFSPIPALSVYLQSHDVSFLGGEFGANTFRIVIAILSKIGLGEPPHTLIQNFVYVPNSTNIYTYYLLPIEDFGWISVAVFPLIYGFGHGAIYKYANTHKYDDFAMFVLIVSYLPLLQSTGGETYFSLVSFWIQLIVLGYLCTVRIKLSRGAEGWS